jgi:HTH-type transcriptional regulator/antitoxin HipB
MPAHARTPTQLGALLKRERRTSGLTQAQLGERIGRRQATISKLENGEPATQLSVLFDVLSVLNLELTFVPRGKATPPDIESLF